MKPNNPFLISGYHSPEFFCDREQETAKILDALSNGRNVTLIAPRRMGKTGLIRHAFYHLKEQQPEIVTLYMDIFSTQSLGDFVRLFANTVLGKLDSAPQKALSRISQFIRSCRPVFTFDEITGVPKVTIDVAPAEEENTLKEIFDYLASSEKRCYIAIDEFQQITEYDEKGVEALLRSYIQFLPNVNFIFAGSMKHVMQEMFTSSARPFYNSTDILELKEIPADIYIPFIIDNFKKEKKNISFETVEKVYNLFNGHTFYIQKTFNESFADTPKGGICDISTVENAINYIIDLNETLYQEILSNISEKQKEVLYAIAKDGTSQNLTSAQFVKRHKLTSASSVQSASKKLLEKDIITHVNKTYSLTNKFFALWIARLYSNRNKIFID